MKESVWRQIQQRLQDLKNVSGFEKEISLEEKDQILKKRADKLRHTLDEVTLTETQIELISFQIASNSYGIEVSFVDEIFEADSITRIPCVPAYFSGIINYRGSPITVINLQKLFDLRDDRILEYNVSLGINSGANRSCISTKKIIIVKSQGGTLGILTDSIERLLKLPLAKVHPVSSVLLQKNRVLKSEIILKNKMLLILDIEALVNDSRLVVNENI